MLFECCAENTTFETVDKAPPAYRKVNGEMLLLVTTPAGYHEGNLVTVKSPFGTRKVNVIIPDGMEEGDKFTVAIPAPNKQMSPAEAPTFSSAVENFFLPTPTIVGEVVNQ